MTHEAWLDNNNEHIANLEMAIKIATHGIQRFIDGNYPHPRQYRPNHCKHGAAYHDECAQCDSEYFEQLLKDVKAVVEGSIRNECPK